MRNKQCPLCGLAPIEHADEPPIPASGGNRIGGEIMRNKQCPLCGLAPIEHAELGARSPQRIPFFGLYDLIVTFQSTTSKTLSVIKSVERAELRIETYFVPMLHSLYARLYESQLLTLNSPL